MIANLEFVYKWMYELAQLLTIMFLGYLLKENGKQINMNQITLRSTLPKDISQCKLYCKQLITALKFGDNCSHIQIITEGEVEISLSSA